MRQIDSDCQKRNSVRPSRSFVQKPAEDAGVLKARGKNLWPLSFAALPTFSALGGVAGELSSSEQAPGATLEASGRQSGKTYSAWKREWCYQSEGL